MTAFEPVRFFASDNASSAHPRMIEAIAAANSGHEAPYGDDRYTILAGEKLCEFFKADCETYFVWNGTGANVTALSAMMPTYGAVICADTAHINTDECGAFEYVVGGKIYTVTARNGKITPDDIAAKVDISSEHHNRPCVVSITELTECGTAYTPGEIREIADYAHSKGLLLHMDGARISNAAAFLGCHIADISSLAGVDVLSFGGTKNGMIAGESVVFFNRELARDFRFIRKQSLQLSSKMRYMAAQYLAFIEDDLWLDMASHANRLAASLAEGLLNIPGVRLGYPVEGNEVFINLPKPMIAPLVEKYKIIEMGAGPGSVRLVLSHDSLSEDVDEFLEYAMNLARKLG